MLGIQLHRRPGSGGADLAYLRKSVIWASTTNTNTNANTNTNDSTLRGQRGALQERLEEILVLELHKDGGRTYLSFTVRGLYKHVLAAITSKISGKRERDEVQTTTHAVVHPNGDSDVQQHASTSRVSMSADNGSGGASGVPASLGKSVARDALSSPVVLGALSAHPEDDGNSPSPEHAETCTPAVGTGTAAAPDEEKEEESALAKSPVAAAHKSNRTSATPNTRPVLNIQPVTEGLPRAEPVTYRERLGGYL
jgi:hypothetical protein